MELLFDVLGVVVGIGSGVLACAMAYRLGQATASHEKCVPKAQADLKLEMTKDAYYRIGVTEGKRIQGGIPPIDPMDLLKLCHPDRHPEERKALATRVTQQINQTRASR